MAHTAAITADSANFPSTRATIQSDEPGEKSTAPLLAHLGDL